MGDRVRARLSHVWILSAVEPGVEQPAMGDEFVVGIRLQLGLQNRRGAAFMGADPQPMHKRDGALRYVRIGFQICLGIEEGRGLPIF
jgi:hypothetical protein